MIEDKHVDLDGFVAGLTRRNPGQPEFIQAVTEVAEDIFDFTADRPEYHRWQILRRIAESDRVVSFRVVWQDDKNNSVGAFVSPRPIAAVPAQGS